MKPATLSVEMQAVVLTDFDTIIDVRSAAEYEEDHVPGAVNLPVLDDAERARVGTLHQQDSPFVARRTGAALVARNIARHLEGALAGMPRTWRPLVYCWRGGKRSGAFAHVLREVGWDARTLAGGYKAYRRFVVAQLASLPQRLSYRVIHGATGSGKSRLLQALAAGGAQVLDLEALAAHRGSVLGGLPDRAQPSQKRFESMLLDVLQSLDPRRTVFVEGESRRIGQVQLPDALIQAMRQSACVVLEAPAAVRVQLLAEEYSHFFTARDRLSAQLECLTALHGAARVREWTALAQAGAWEELVGVLLREHYDPAYRRSSARNFALLGEASILRVANPRPEHFAALARELLRSEPVAPEVAPEAA